MRIGFDYETVECVHLDGGVAVVAFSKDVHRSKNGSPYRRFKLIVGGGLVGGAAFYRGGEIVADFPKEGAKGKGTGTMRYRADAKGKAVPGTGRLWLPGRAEEALQPLAETAMATG